MYTVIKPDTFTSSIMGNQGKKDVCYRWFQYVLKQECDDGILLYNVLSCEMLFLTAVEVGEKSANEKLIEKWFLVPEDFEDFSFAKKVKRIRQLVYKTDTRKKLMASIDRFWILTTTECNARCFYCHESGIPQLSMSSEIADDVLNYILKHGASKIHIMWYGGEPLVNLTAIDYISQGLLDHGIEFNSSMISNGYMFDDERAHKAKTLWHLDEVQITLDGLEDTYNRVKAYVRKDDQSLFYVILGNIEVLLQQGIHVKIRMNLDEYNVDELFALADLLLERFHDYKNCSIYSAPFLEDCLGTCYKRTEEKRRYVFQKYFELNTILNQHGKLTRSELATTMNSEMRCIALANVRVIFPDGKFAYCHDYQDGIIEGDIYENEPPIERRWEYAKCIPETAKCEQCIRFPQCVRLEKCFNNKCNDELINEWVWTTRNEMIWAYEKNA